MRRLGFTLALLCVSAGSVLGQVKNLEEAPEIAPELTGQGLPLIKCEAYNRVYDQHLGSD